MISQKQLAIRAEGSRLSTGKSGSLVAALLSLLGFAVLLGSLKQDGLPSRLEAFFYVPMSEAPTKELLPLNLLETKDGVNHHQILLESKLSNNLYNAPQITLAMAAPSERASVISAGMVFSERATGKVVAAYVGKAGTVLKGNRKLEFRRTSTETTVPSSEALNVAIDIESRGALGLAVEEKKAYGEPFSKLFCIGSGENPGQLRVRNVIGSYATSSNEVRYSKAQLLSYAWGFGTSGQWIVWSIIGMAVFFWLIGILLVMNCLSAGSASMQNVLASAGSCGLLLSICVVYLVIVPPLQAPDEADHFLTYAEFNKRPDLAARALEISNLGHFERIKSRADEMFSSYDVGKPLRSGWASHISTTDPNRSPLTRMFWSVIGHFMGVRDAGIALLCLRFANIVFVAFCLFISLILAEWSLHPVKISFPLALPTILVPAVGFYSMAVSNYPLLFGGYIIQATALGMLLNQSADLSRQVRLDAAAGFLVGLGIAVTITAADNGCLSLAFWAVLIPAYFFLKGQVAQDVLEARRAVRQFLLQLVGALLLVVVIVGACNVGFHFLTPVILLRVNSMLARASLGFLGAQAFVLCAFLICLVSSSLLSFSAGIRVRGCKWSVFPKISVVLLFLAGVCFVSFARISQIPNIQEDHSKPSLVSYTLGVLSSLVKSFWPGPPDWFVSGSFWCCFGWLDTPGPAYLLNILRIGTGVGLVFLFVESLRSCKYFAQSGFLLASLGSLLVFSTCIAIAYHAMGCNVHGRYLFGFYIFVLTMACEGYRRVLVDLNRWCSAPSVLSGILIVAVAIQCAAWLTIVNRYF